MKPIVIKNNTLFKIITFPHKMKNIEGLSWFIFIFLKKGEDREWLIRHETIHFYQQLEMLFIGQWLWYGISWLYYYIRLRDTYKAYRAVPFEEEAYNNQDNPLYLKRRKLWGWAK